MNRELICREQRKRETCWNPVERWRVLQQTIAWVDAQQSVPRNSPAGCLAKQAIFLNRPTVAADAE